MIDLIMQFLGYEKTENIKVPKEFKIPKSKKMHCKTKFYHFTGKFVDKIIINNANELLDGYTTLILSKWKELKYVKVIRMNVSVERYLEEFKAYRVQRKNYNRNFERRREIYK